MFFEHWRDQDAVGPDVELLKGGVVEFGMYMRG
jgi:hypothetical protein